MRKIFVLWLLLLSVVSLAQPYSVKQLGIEKGLSNNYVVSIAQDKQGFLWFATEEGLNKFDGTRFITYLKNEDLTRQGITGNELNCLLDDPQDSILWIGTQRAGLNAYDYVNKTGGWHCSIRKPKILSIFIIVRTGFLIPYLISDNLMGINFGLPWNLEE